MRIAIFTETFLPKIDGIVNTLTYLLAHLERRGHECVVFAPDGGPSCLSLPAVP
jgi:phosphatidylinositol alpha 1,6-mannosyltransferase